HFERLNRNHHTAIHYAPFTLAPSSLRTRTAVREKITDTTIGAKNREQPRALNPARLKPSSSPRRPGSRRKRGAPSSHMPGLRPPPERRSVSHFPRTLVC